MRSTKDLKGIVQHARTKPAPIKAIHEDVGGEGVSRRPSRGASNTPGAQTDEYNFVKNQRVGGANYASVGGSNEDDVAKKLRKLEVLAAADKDTIEA